MNVLSIDWDFFIPVAPIYEMDWGHHEGFNPAIQDFLWQTRAAGFLGRNEPLLQVSDMDFAKFWARFNIKGDATLFVAESHMHMVDPHVSGTYPTKIWNYDAHHDCGYSDAALVKAGEGVIDCANWLAWYSLSQYTECHVVLPAWRGDHPDLFGVPTVPVQVSIDAGEALSDPIDLVFICRSASWTPPWLDEHFVEFVKASPIKELFNIGPDVMSPRYWDPQNALQLAEAQAAQMAEWQATHGKTNE